MSDPIFYGGALLVAAYVLWVWLADLRACRRQAAGVASTDNINPVFPGATPAGLASVAVAVVGALVLLAAETGGEYALQITAEQTKMTVLFGLYTLAAAFIEELIFRGYLYYDKGSRAQLVGSIVGVSLIFALLHPYLWQWQTPPASPSWQFWHGRLVPTLDTKAVFSTAIVFARSLWFYCLLFWPANPRRSLIPPIAAHLATNAGVFALKALQGKVSGLILDGSWRLF